MYRILPLSLCLALAWGIVPARAAIITVTSISGDTGGPDCTLRDAITAANTDTPTGGCPAGNGADTIELPALATITLTTVDNDINGPNGLPSITTEMTINGHGTTVGRSSDADAAEFRILYVGGNADLTMNGLTVYNGSAMGSNKGGGIFNFGGNLVFTSCILRSNSSADRGAGLYSVGAGANLDFTGCLFEGNISKDYGGGIFNAAGDLTCRNCGFAGNASVRGSGIWNAGTFELVDCTFQSNTGVAFFNAADDGLITNCLFADNQGGWRGGGMWNSGEHPILRSCRFLRNSAGEGGGLSNFGDPLVVDCTFAGNIATGEGGGAVNTHDFPTFINCLFTANQAADGGAILNWQGATLINCTMTGNIANQGAGMYGSSSAQSTLKNCILWGNDGVQFQGTGETSITYSDIEGGYVGVGNIDADPLFIDADGPDNVPGNEDDNLRLQPGSPCIDAADNTAVPTDPTDADDDINTDRPIPYDLDGNPRFVDDPDTRDTGTGGCPPVDIGAYEYQEGLSDCPCPADLDGDGLVGPEDLAEVLGAWGPCEGCPADFNGDNVVDAADLALLLGSWGPCE